MPAGQPVHPALYLQTGAPISPSVAPISERYPSGPPVDLNALFLARQLDATEEELREIEFIVDFVKWISASEFLRLQLQEPLVGDPSTNCPPAVERQGIKGHSVYSALFHHLDMETFSCKMCDHSVKDDLEDAIAHQRVHFQHYPYQCLPQQIQWYVPVLLPCGSVLIIHFDSARSALQIKRGWRNISPLLDIR